jgi:hypothetical protein
LAAQEELPVLRQQPEQQHAAVESPSADTNEDTPKAGQPTR